MPDNFQGEKKKLLSIYPMETPAKKVSAEMLIKDSEFHTEH